MLSAQDLGDILKDSTIYQCKSDTCSDNGGCCVLIVPCFFESPDSCVNPSAFTDNGDDPECKWEEI